MSKSSLFKGIPISQVMAFNSVSAPAYVGRALAFHIDGSLDDEPDIEVIVVARNDTELRRFYKAVGQPFPPADKQKEVAVAWAKYLRIRNQADIPNGEHGQINPDHKDATIDTKEDW